MKQQLWALNSALLGIFTVAILLSALLKQEPPRFRVRKPFILPTAITKEPTPAEMAFIYENDIFDTFIKKEEPGAPRKLVTPIPEPKELTPPQPPATVKQEFLAPLKIILKGIAFSSDAKKSIGIVEDETKKELIYHIGDQIKGAQVIKIGQTSITLLRTNGQHETFSLRQDDILTAQPEKKTWENVLKKIDGNNFKIDKMSFKKRVPSIGSLIQQLSLITMYKNGMPTGISVGSLEPGGLGLSMGLQQNDLLLSINGIKTADNKERIKIYEAISNTKQGESITVQLRRNQQPITLSYQLERLEKIEKKVFIGKPSLPKPKEKIEAPDKSKLFKLSRLQERERQRRKFSTHHKPNQDKAIEEIRRRLLENIQNRVRNIRRR